MCVCVGVRDGGKTLARWPPKIFVYTHRIESVVRGRDSAAAVAVAAAARVRGSG